jgi:polysaccharide biosynthesis/export protein
MESVAMLSRKKLLSWLISGMVLGTPLMGRPSLSTQGTQAPTFQERYPRYRLRAGDVLDLNFTFTPEFNQTVTVQPDGYINLRGLGDMRVSEKTTPEVVEAVRSAYSKILRDPTVTVELKEFEKPYFTVTGQVNKPGKFDLRGDTTVVEAIAIAGGITDKAKSSQIYVLRKISEEWAEVKTVDMKKMLAKQDLSEDLHLRPGDFVYVQKSTMAKLDRFIPTANMGMYLNPFTR